MNVEWFDLPEVAREAVTDGIRSGRDLILRRLAEGDYQDVEAPWREPEVIAAIYNAALVRLGATP
jgi:hypothetical protein